MALAVVGAVSTGVTSLISIITTVLDRAAAAEQARLDKETEAARESAAALVNAAHPPYFYPGISARARNPNIPFEYTAEGIEQTLEKDIIPVGYSLSQLEQVGFKHWVDRYRNRANKEIIATAATFAKEMEVLAGVLEDAITGEDSELRDVARATGASKSLVNGFRTFSANIRKGQISETAFKAKIRLLQGMLSLIGIEQGRRDAESALRLKVTTTEQKELDVVQALASRFIEKGF